MKTKQFYPSLTGLKGIFMFCIIFYHTLSAISSPLIDAIPFTSFLPKFGGDLGNSMFFILSGFLMSTSYAEKIRNQEIPFLPYLKKRLCKIYPLYILTNLVMLLYFIIDGLGLSVINLQRIAFTVLLQGFDGFPCYLYNGSAWFICSLFFCYCLFYLICFYAAKPTQYYISIFLAIVTGHELLMGSLPIHFFTSVNGLAMMNFFIGCALAEVYPPKFTKAHPRFFPALCFLLLVLIGFLLSRFGIEIIAGNINVAFSFVICPMVFYLALESKLFSSFLSSKPIQFLGKISLSVFLWHTPIFCYFCLGLRTLGLELSEFQYFLYLILTLLLSTLSYRFIEKPSKSIHSSLSDKH